MTGTGSDSIVPEESAIPKRWRIDSLVEQRQYLCDGKIKEWTGPQQNVFSPLWERTPEGIRQKLIGSYPLLGEQQSLEALEAACRAYNHGRGAWPTTSVEEAKNAAIVLKDADLDQAVRECVLGALSYNGQGCTALKMIFVQQEIVDAFIAQFRTVVEQLKSGMPWEAGVSITPLLEPDKTRYLTELIDDARAKGARVVNRNGGSVNIHGTLSVSDALRVFTIRTLVAAKESDANRGIIKSIVTERSSRFLSTDFIL